MFETILEDLRISVVHLSFLNMADYQKNSTRRRMASVEEQGLLLLVWRHHITNQYIKDVL